MRNQALPLDKFGKHRFAVGAMLGGCALQPARRLGVLPGPVGHSTANTRELDGLQDQFTSAVPFSHLRRSSAVPANPRLAT